MKSLLEIEEAIAELPADARRQLVQDLPALCPDAFPADAWDPVLRDSTPRPALTSLLDQLDAQFPQKPESFIPLNVKSLGTRLPPVAPRIFGTCITGSRRRFAPPPVMPSKDSPKIRPIPGFNSNV